MAVVVLALVATSPTAPRQQMSNHMAGSAREPKEHSMRTSDARRHKDSMGQCSGDLWYTEELEERAVSVLLWQHEGLQDKTRSKAAEWIQ